MYILRVLLFRWWPSVSTPCFRLYYATIGAYNSDRTRKLQKKKIVSPLDIANGTRKFIDLRGYKGKS
jgi:hypothetical protein